MVRLPGEHLPRPAVTYSAVFHEWSVLVFILVIRLEQRHMILYSPLSAKRLLYNAPAAGAAHYPSSKRMLWARYDGRSLLSPFDLKLRHLPGPSIHDGWNAVLHYVLGELSAVADMFLGYRVKIERLLQSNALDDTIQFCLRDFPKGGEAPEIA